MKSTLLAAVLALCAASASAQMVFTSVSLDGQKTFSDRLDTSPEPVPEALPVFAGRRTPAGTMAKGSRSSALVNSSEAGRRLARAQLDRKQGMQPLAGEHSTIADASVPNQRYWRRQEKLREAVEQAQRRSNETQRLQLARQ
jgi:hypothetical protein